MSFNQKTIFTSIFICFIIFTGGFWYYKKIYPKYVPPPLKPELTITIIPGWNLRQVAEYLVKQGFASSSRDVYKITGKPAYDYRPAALVLPKIDELKILNDKPAHISLEGYLAPETYRIYQDSDIQEVIAKLVAQRDKQITDEMRNDAQKSGRSFFEILTMASILEKEVTAAGDKSLVADILWRRYDKNWALQVDSSVHYAINKTGTVFTTKQERDFVSPWNTYKYPGLPLGPIANPGLDSIKAALHPEKNAYWYFLTGKDGAVYYGKTLEEHNNNKAKL